MTTDAIIKKVQNQDEIIFLHFEFQQAVTSLAAGADVRNISARTLDIHQRQMTGDNYEYQDTFNALCHATQSHDRAVKAIAAVSSNFLTRAYREWRYDQANKPEVTCLRTAPRALTKLVFGPK